MRSLKECTRADPVLQQGIPNLEAAAVVVLRHWNDGKIPFYTKAPRTATTTVNTGSTEVAPSAAAAAGGMQVDNAANSGDAILSGFTEAFDLDGLLAKFGGSGEFDQEEDADLVKSRETRVEGGSMPVDAE